MNTSPDFRALCAELVKAVDDASSAVDLISDCLNPNDFADQIKESCELIGKHDDLLIRAHAKLETKPQGPTNQDLIQLAIDTRLYRFQATAGDPVQYEMTEQQIHAYARAVIARWGAIDCGHHPLASSS